jgi:ADP-heptose:LPS heptosyltransferase
VKIPCLDGIVRWGTLAAHGTGLLRTAETWSATDLDRAQGILVVISTALGDSVCFTPALEGLRVRFPRARLVGLYHAAFAELYRRDPRLDAVIPYHGKYRRVGETVRALREARCEVALLAHIAEPDVVPLVVLGGSRLLLRMVGRDTAYRRMMANPAMLAAPQTQEHAVRRAIRMVEALGGAARSCRPSLPVEREARDRIGAWMGRQGIAPEAVRIGFHPGASARNKQWPPECYGEVGRQLLAADPRVHLILTGAPQERELAGRIAAELGGAARVTDAAGAVGIEELPALVASLDLLLSADTGVAHVAYATRTPSVTLFWRSDPAISGPICDLDRHAVISRQPLCPPCRTRTCRYPSCAREIAPAQVLEAVRSVLGRAAVTADAGAAGSPALGRMRLTRTDGGDPDGSRDAG